MRKKLKAGAVMRGMKADDARERMASEQRQYDAIWAALAESAREALVTSAHEAALAWDTERTRRRYEEVHRSLAGDIERELRELREFAENISKDDTHSAAFAFEYGDGRIEAAASLRAAGWLLKRLEETGSVRDTVEFARGYVLQHTQYPVCSTSTCSRMIQAHETAYYARFVSVAKWYV